MKIYGMGTSEGGDRFNKMQHILQYRPMVGINGTDDLLLGDEDPLLVDDTGNVMQNLCSLLPKRLKIVNIAHSRLMEALL